MTEEQDFKEIAELVLSQINNTSDRREKLDAIQEALENAFGDGQDQPLYDPTKM